MDRHDSQEPRERRSGLLRRRETNSPWPRIVGLVLYVISVTLGNASNRHDAAPPAPTTAPCEACVTTWLDHRDPCSEVRERLPDHDPRTLMTARSWHDRAWPRYELGLAHGYVDCEITPISSATDSDVLRAGAFVLDEAQLRVAGPHVTHRRDQTSLRWLVPGYATDSPHHTTGRLALRVQKGWRTRWLRIEVQERTGPVRE